MGLHRPYSRDQGSRVGCWLHRWEVGDGENNAHSCIAPCGLGRTSPSSKPPCCSLGWVPCAGVSEESKQVTEGTRGLISHSEEAGPGFGVFLGARLGGLQSPSHLVAGAGSSRAGGGCGGGRALS